MNTLIKKINTQVAVTGCALMLCSSVAFSGTMGPVATVLPGKIYVGAFGGGGAVMGHNMSQYGTAYYNSELGGPLAVNAFGTAHGDSNWVVGGHVGYQWSEQLLNLPNSSLMIAPATELEGYYIGGVTASGDDVNNDTTRLLPQLHDFSNTYPMKTGVFLINAILNVDHDNFGKFHPYIGVGIGSAIVSISGAEAFQVSPLEVGVNHYNSDPNDSAATFAAQPKVGVHFDLNPRASLFAEYRFLYISSTAYTFGSTVYTNHVATSSWTVKMGSQLYNMGTVGVRYDL